MTIISKEDYKGVKYGDYTAKINLVHGKLRGLNTAL